MNPKPDSSPGYSDAPSLRTSIPSVNALLDNQASALGHDFIGYRN